MSWQWIGMSKHIKINSQSSGKENHCKPRVLCSAINDSCKEGGGQSLAHQRSKKLSFSAI